MSSETTQTPSGAEDSGTDKENRLTFAELQKEAAGKWADIFEDLAHDELGAAVASAPFHVPCPSHGGQNGFRLFPHYIESGQSICNTCGAQTNGFRTLAFAKKWDIKKATAKVAEWLRKEVVEPRPVRKPPVLKPRVDPAVAYQRICKVWRASKDLAGSAAERYLMERGIWRENLSQVLRAHDGLTYVHGKERTNYGTFPCLLAPVKDKAGKLVTIHRIFLTPEGHKAPVPDPKKMMSQHSELRGAAIKLFPAEETLGLAEGIETALAAHAISRMPVWSCISAVLMELVEIPDSVKHVVIWADLDVSNRGIEAAERLANRLEAEGKTVEICLPQGPIPTGEKGIDWLDVMLTRGLNGFPAKWRRWRPAPVALAA